MGSDKMLRNLKVESHTREVLCNKAKSIGTICSVDELHKNKPKNGVLIGKIVKIGKITRKDGFVLRDSCEFVLKEIGADGTYGQEFLAVLFGDAAIEAEASKFMMSDKLLFCDPQVFENPQYDKKERPTLHVQFGLRCDDQVVWYSRKHSEELAVIRSSPHSKKTSKDSDNRESSYNTSHPGIIDNNRLSAVNEKNTINHQKNNNIFSKSINTNIKSKSNNVIYKRLLFTRKSNAPYMSDSDNSLTQNDPGATRLSSSAVSNTNYNCIERETATTSKSISAIVSKYFSGNSQSNSAKHEATPETENVPSVPSGYDSRQDGADSQHAETSDFAGILEEVSAAINRKNLPFVHQTKSPNVSPKKALEEMSRNSVEKGVEVVTLDDLDDDRNKTTTVIRHQKNTPSPNNEKTLKTKRIFSNKKGNNKTVTGKVINKKKDVHDKFKQTTIVVPRSEHHTSPGKVSNVSNTSSNKNNNNKCKDIPSPNMKDSFSTSVSKNQDKTTICDTETISSVSEVHNAETAKAEDKHKKWAYQLQLLENMLEEDDKEMGKQVTSIVHNASCSTLSDETHHQGTSANSQSVDVAIISSGKKTKIVTPILKAHNNDKQIVNKPCCKKRVSFTWSDEENNKDNDDSSTNNSVSLLASGDSVEVDSVLHRKQLSPSISDSRSCDFCADIQVSEKCSNLKGNKCQDMANSKNCKILMENSIKLLKLSHNKSTSSLSSCSNKALSTVNTAHSFEDNESSCSSDEGGGGGRGRDNDDDDDDAGILHTITDKKISKTLSNGMNAFMKTNVIDECQGGSGTVFNNSPCQTVQNATTIVSHSAQDSVVNCVGTKHKLDDYADGIGGIQKVDLTKLKRFASKLKLNSEQESAVCSASSILLQINWSSVVERKDVAVSTSCFSDSEDDAEDDIYNDPDGRWSVLYGASIIDVYPPLTENTLDLVSGFCNFECFHRYSDLIWIKNSNDMNISLCPVAFREGIKKPSPVMFMFTLVVTDNEGRCHNLRVYKDHAEAILRCKAIDYIMDKDKRAEVINILKSYILSSNREESSTSGMANKKLTICVFNKDDIHIVVKHIQTSRLRI